MAEESRKAELIAELARARQQLTGSLQALGHDLNVVARVKSGFEQHRYAWLGGAGLLGLLLARLPARRKEVAPIRKARNTPVESKVVKTGLALSALKIAFDLVRPALTKWLTRRAVAYAAERFNRSPRA